MIWIERESDKFYVARNVRLKHTSTALSFVINKYMRDVLLHQFPILENKHLTAAGDVYLSKRAARVQSMYLLCPSISRLADHICSRAVEIVFGDWNSTVISVMFGIWKRGTF